MKAFFVFAPIVTLLLIGLIISLKSSVREMEAPRRIKALACTISTMVVELAAYLLVLLGLQSVVGFPVKLLIGF